MVGVAEWFRTDRTAADEYEEATRADTHQHEVRRRMDMANRDLGEARVHVSALIDQHNLDGRRILGFLSGSAVVVALVVLDAIPLNWAAQAFDLNAAESWLVTLILLAASVGAMAGLEVTRHDARRHAALVAVTLTAYAGLVALRTMFLVTVAGEGMAAALLQAVVLSAISAGLVFLGSAVMARTRPQRLSRALAAARRAQRASEASEAAWRRAEEKLERHLVVLRRQLVRQPLYTSVPAGMPHADWVTALERALRALFASR
jgi:CheY-like chemotaxis protein